MAEERKAGKGNRRFWRLRSGFENASKCEGVVRMRDADGNLYEALCEGYHDHAEFDLIEEGKAIESRSALEHLRATRSDLIAESRLKTRLLDREQRDAKKVVAVIEGRSTHPFPEVVAFHRRVSEELERLIPEASAPKRPSGSLLFEKDPAVKKAVEDWREAERVWIRRRRRLRVSLYDALQEESTVETVGTLEEIPLPEADDDLPF